MADDLRLGLTFGDLVLRVAEYLGVAETNDDGTVAIPTNARNLEACKRVVNDGFRKFYIAKPRWRWASQTISITFDTDGEGSLNVGGDNWRYYMPDGFYGHVLSPLTYGENVGHMEIVEVPEHIILGLYATGDTTGWPNRYAIRKIANDPKGRWELLVYPKPSSAETVTCQIHVWQNKMVELTDRPNCGAPFEDAVLASALNQAELQFEDSSTIKAAQWQEALADAVRIDERSVPKRLGDAGPRIVRPYTGVDTYTNIDGTVHTC